MLLQAQKYDELISLALSDEFLPHDNPIDERNIRIDRLQFAFQAALNQKRYEDATRLALRAGEEVAGDKRQLSLLTKNVDLIAPLQNNQRVQELAYRRILHGDWEGSENIYSASLLSSVSDFKGEARGYLRSGEHWLRLYFEEKKKNNNRFQQNLLQDEDIVELELSHLNLFGVKDLVKSLQSWNPPEVVYRITKLVIKRLIDAGKFDIIQDILQIDIRNQHLMLALAEQLLKVGRFPDSKAADICLELLATKRCRIAIPKFYFKETLPSALIAFIESCAARDLPTATIMRVLNYYFPLRATSLVSSKYQLSERNVYLRTLALRYVLSENFEPNLEEIFPEIIPNEIDQDKTYHRNQDIQEFRDLIERLLPWYIARASVLIKKTGSPFDLIKNIKSRSKNARSYKYRGSDKYSYEISGIIIDILTLIREADKSEIEKIYKEYIKENRNIRVNDRLNALRAAIRIMHLSSIRDNLEQSVFDEITSLIKEEPETKADWFIDLARAVLPQKPDDAAAYFHYAIEAVSKFGDELRDRWQAITALASRVAENGHTLPEITYRFMRCAELAGDYKAIDYNEAMKICTRLSPASALSTISRWHDREVGSFYDQITALASELVRSNILFPSIGWTLSAFFYGNELVDYALLCIANEPSTSKRDYILNSAIHDLRLNEADLKSWQKINQLIQNLGMENKKVDSLIHFYLSKPKAERKNSYSQNVNLQNKKEPEITDWESVFGDLDLKTVIGISQALNRFNSSNVNRRDHNAFWRQFFIRINENEVTRFLTSLVESEIIDQYDIQHAMDCFPTEWYKKASVKRYWPAFIISLVRRYASELTNPIVLEYFCKHLKIDNSLMPMVKESILEGLSKNSSFNDASTYFNFVNTVCPFLSTQEALSLLSYALSRFELHIPDDFADGPWADWLDPPKDSREAFTGFVWSALGSPSAELRWRAAHCVRKLVDLGNELEINSLMDWLENNSIGPFGSCKYPFYKLHACQYLMIALARTSFENSHLLRHHQSIFAQYALDKFPHVLINKFASDIALNIEKAFPGTYQKDIVEKLIHVGKSKLPVVDIKSHDIRDKNKRKLKEKTDTSKMFYHGWDFDRYWFEPLGDVFNISREEVEELATEVIFNEWDVDNDGSYESDPRVVLWRASRNEKEVWHDHGSYPYVDKYNFYLSYHAMLVVAAKLLEKLPVVHYRDWKEDEWGDWIHRHLLTKNSGHWLSDRRDPAPLLEPDWIGQSSTKNWCTEITINDFLGSIFVENNGKTWLNVFGSWSEGDLERTEKYSITSALVFPDTSQSLLHALSTCADPYDYKLPDYQEYRMEFETQPFLLNGWIWREYMSLGLDKFDPFGGQIDFPPYQIGERIMEKMGLKTDSEERKWFSPDQKEETVVCELWSTRKNKRDQDPYRKGIRLCASLEFLKNLCLTMNCELVLEVQIERSFNRESYMKDEDGDGYTPPYSKIFIITANGELRSTETNFKLRKVVG